MGWCPTTTLQGPFLLGMQHRRREPGALHTLCASALNGRTIQTLVTRETHPNSNRTVHTAISIAATSEMRPAGTACRVFRMFTAPKYTAIT